MIAPSAQYDGLSFFPDGYLARRAQHRANRLCGSLLVVALLGVSAAYAITERTLDQVRAEHASVSTAFKREADRLHRIGTMQKEQKMLEGRARLAESLVERTPRAAVLTELRELLPEQASLVELALTSRVRAAPAKSPEDLVAERRRGRNAAADAPTAQPKTYDVGLRVGGIAYTDVQVAQYINRLSRSRYFHDVNLIFSRDFQRDGQAVRRFDVELVVRPEPLPASDVDDASFTATEATPLR